MWDWVGGRFSVWSAVGFAAACAIGFERFEEFLAGGHEIDKHFADAPLEKNVPVLMALCGVWNTNFLGAATHAVLPYSQRAAPASRPTCSSSRWNRTASASTAKAARSTYATAPVLWGAEGTVSQHSFHQLLHQGTQVVPCDFIDLDLEQNLSAQLRARRPMRWRSAPTTRRCRRTGSTPATVLRAFCRSMKCTRATSGRLIAALRAQGLHAGRHLEHQQLRPVGRRAGQGTGKKVTLRRQIMDQETFNLSIRKFLKMVGVNSQREIEQAVQRVGRQAGRRASP